MNSTTFTEEQIQAMHKCGIGGSESSALFGLNPWITEMTLWFGKTGRAAPVAESIAMRVGTELEDLVARMWCERTGRKVVKFPHWLKDGAMIGTVDRLVIPLDSDTAFEGETVTTTEALECKTTSVPWTDGVPTYYQMQCQHYMALMPSVMLFHVAALDVAHKTFDFFTIPRDDEVIAAIRKRCNDWWRDYVEADTPPPPATAEDCRLAFKRPAAVAVNASDAAIRAAIFLAKCKGAVDAIEAEAEKAEGVLMASMGDAADTLLGVDGKAIATWKMSKGRRVVDWQGLAKALGATDEQIEAHTNQLAPSRRFLLKVPKPEINLAEYTAAANGVKAIGEGDAQ